MNDDLADALRPIRVTTRGDRMAVLRRGTDAPVLAGPSVVSAGLSTAAKSATVTDPGDTPGLLGGHGGVLGTVAFTAGPIDRSYPELVVQLPPQSEPVRGAGEPGPAGRTTAPTEATPREQGVRPRPDQASDAGTGADRSEAQRTARPGVSLDFPELLPAIDSGGTFRERRGGADGFTTEDGNATGGRPASTERPPAPDETASSGGEPTDGRTTGPTRPPTARSSGERPPVRRDETDAADPGLQPSDATETGESLSEFPAAEGKSGPDSEPAGGVRRRELPADTAAGGDPTILVAGHRSLRRVSRASDSGDRREPSTARRPERPPSRIVRIREPTGPLRTMEPGNAVPDTTDPMGRGREDVAAADTDTVNRTGEGDTVARSPVLDTTRFTRLSPPGQRRRESAGAKQSETPEEAAAVDDAKAPGGQPEHQMAAVEQPRIASPPLVPPTAVERPETEPSDRPATEREPSAAGDRAGKPAGRRPTGATVEPPDIQVVRPPPVAPDTVRRRVEDAGPAGLPSEPRQRPETTTAEHHRPDKARTFSAPSPDSGAPGESGGRSGLPAAGNAPDREGNRGVTAARRVPLTLRRPPSRMSREADPTGREPEWRSSPVKMSRGGPSPSEDAAGPRPRFPRLAAPQDEQSGGQSRTLPSDGPPRLVTGRHPRGGSGPGGDRETPAAVVDHGLGTPTEPSPSEDAAGPPQFAAVDRALDLPGEELSDARSRDSREMPPLVLGDMGGGTRPSGGDERPSSGTAGGDRSRGLPDRPVSRGDGPADPAPASRPDQSPRIEPSMFGGSSASDRQSGSDKSRRQGTPPPKRDASRSYSDFTFRSLAPRVDATSRSEPESRDVTYSEPGDGGRDRGTDTTDIEDLLHTTGLERAASPAEVDRLVERLRRGLERKRRIDRERRGL